VSIPVHKGHFWVLDFDIENRPLSYWVPDRPTAEITAIAASWVDRPASETFVWLLKPAETDAEHRQYMVDMLLGFKELYDAAQMVTGHYITKHDLPIINGALMDWGLPTLGQKMVQDTKTDMVKKADVPATQEYLATMEKVVAKKIHMTQHEWRQGNRLTIEGRTATEKRVRGDVRQHRLLRKAMLRDGLLHSPRIWRP
jgi:hypothetical protein